MRTESVENTNTGLTEVRIIAGLDEISQDPANVRKHSERNLDSIIASLRASGQRTPIVIDRRNVILKGNGTYEAAKRIGWPTIWVTITDLTGADAVRYAIADNRTAELAEWDDAGLAATLQGLKDDGELIEDLGWNAEELGEILTGEWPDLDGDPDGAAKGADIDAVHETYFSTIPKIVARGDIWEMGRFKLFCHDPATEWKSIFQKLEEDRILLIYPAPSVVLAKDDSRYALVIPDPDIASVAVALFKATGRGEPEKIHAED